MAKALFDAGCKEFSFGVESWDNHVLKVLNKHATAEDNARALEISEKIGITSRMLLMIRTPGQTKNTVPINIDWIKKVPYSIIALTTFFPLPGSDIWKFPDKYGIKILNKNLDDYNLYFFGSKGENPIGDTIELIGRDNEEIKKESQEFREFVKSTGKLNMG